MRAAKQRVEALIQKLPNDCNLEDLQYHLYVIEKISNSVSRSGVEGTFTREEARRRLSKWAGQSPGLDDEPNQG